jgi:hypothetical protein
LLQIQLPLASLFYYKVFLLVLSNRFAPINYVYFAFLVNPPKYVKTNGKVGSVGESLSNNAQNAIQTPTKFSPTFTDSFPEHYWERGKGLKPISWTN